MTFVIFYLVYQILVVMRVWALFSTSVAQFAPEPVKTMTLLLVTSKLNASSPA